jgi:hypothetical protein
VPPGTRAPRQHLLPSGDGTPEGKVATRVLVAYAEEYRTYRETLAAGVRLLRPRAEVRTAAPAELGVELERFDPWVVVCGVPGRPDPGDVLAWVELPPEVGRPARVRVGERRRETPGLTLEGLVVVVDEAEGLVRKKAGRAGDRGPAGFIHPTA